MWTYIQAIVSHTEAHGSVTKHCNTCATDHTQFDTADDKD